MAILAICVVLGSAFLAAVSRLGAQHVESTPDEGNESLLRMKIRPLPDGVANIFLVTRDNGRHWFELEMIDGERLRLRPDEFAARIERDHHDRRVMFRFLNITTLGGMAWVALGMLGQVLFAGRLLLQWLASERSKRSVVPVVFWWMSVAGASMLLTYFIWRRDIVGVLGQGTGWIIYSRNLWLIYRLKEPRIT